MAVHLSVSLQEESSGEDEEEEEDLFDEEGDKFVAPSKNVRFRRFGQEGTRNA